MTRRGVLVGGALLLGATVLLLLLLWAGGSPRPGAGPASDQARDDATAAQDSLVASVAAGAVRVPSAAAGAAGPLADIFPAGSAEAGAVPDASAVPAASLRPVLPERPTPEDLIASCDPVDLRFLAGVERLGSGIPVGALELVRLGQRGASETELTGFITDEIDRPVPLRALAIRWLRERTGAPPSERRPLAGQLPHPEGLVQPLRRVDADAGTP